MNHLLAALHGAQGDWVEVCSVEGVKLVNTASALRVPPERAEASFPFLFYQSPRPLFTWASAQSRAPPAAS